MLKYTCIQGLKFGSSKKKINSISLYFKTDPITLRSQKLDTKSTQTYLNIFG